jgi:hypothetical protein
MFTKTQPINARLTVQGKVNVLKEQMKSVRTQDSIVNEAKSIDVQIAKLTTKIRKVKSPTDKRNGFLNTQNQMKLQLSANHFINCRYL